ncbi:MAG: uroporphyrinogen-III C-methyltransferase [Vicinamibacterales bacterium]
MIHFVGAGPGDAGLVTVRGRECLEGADVVVHDPQVPAAVLRYAREGAELINVGHASPANDAQAAVSYLLAEKAREGKTVVRLKWGDPFIFEHGAEEALFLHEQRVPYEVVPGVPASIAVPAYAGVPVTYPGGGDTVTLVRGYEDDARSLPHIDWAALARLDGTVLCYLTSQQLARVLDAMMAAGWPTDSRAMFVCNGTLPSQETLSGTLEELRDMAQHQPRRTPGLLMAGRVVNFREHLRWFDTRPLFGRRVLITRPRAQATELAARLAALGAEPVEAPMIRIVPPEDAAPLRQAAGEPEAYDWIIFASSNAAEAFMAALLEGQRDVRSLKGPLLCAVGSGTAETLARHGIKVDLVPDEFRAEGIVAALAPLGSLDGARVLLPKADIGRDVIADALRERGAQVTEVIAYRTVLDDAQGEGEPDVYGMLLQGRIDVVTFTSPSAVRNFARVYGEEQVADLLKHTVVATIGPVTTEAVRQIGAGVAVEPRIHTIPALVDAIAAHFASAKPVGG